LILADLGADGFGVFEDAVLVAIGLHPDRAAPHERV